MAMPVTVGAKQDPQGGSQALGGGGIRGTARVLGLGSVIFLFLAPQIDAPSVRSRTRNHSSARTQITAHPMHRGGRWPMFPSSYAGSKGSPMQRKTAQSLELSGTRSGEPRHQVPSAKVAMVPNRPTTAVITEIHQDLLRLRSDGGRLVVLGQGLLTTVTSWSRSETARTRRKFCTEAFCTVWEFCVNDGSAGGRSGGGSCGDEALTELRGVFPIFKRTSDDGGQHNVLISTMQDH